jgi:hypothetical protein
MCFVVNFFRPLTRTAEDALVVMREIEVASGIKFTAIINNSNVGSATDKDGVLSTFNEVEKLSSLSGLPVILTTVTEDIKDDFDGLDVFSLKLQQKYYDIKE